MKSRLRKYKHLKSRINEIKAEIKSVRISQQSLRDIKANIPSDMPKNKNNNDDKMSTTVCKIIDIYEDRIAKLAKELEFALWQIEEIEKHLQQLDEREYNVIKARYVDCIRWDFIPGRLSYSRRQCFRLHDNAIHKLIKLMDK